MDKCESWSVCVISANTGETASAMGQYQWLRVCSGKSCFGARAHAEGQADLGPDKDTMEYGMS
jgi:hypothetical protein